MKSLLIQDTTQEERQKIVEEALGFLGACDDCQGGLADMYDDYIRTTFVRDMKGPEHTGCGY